MHLSRVSPPVFLFRSPLSGLTRADSILAYETASLVVFLISKRTTLTFCDQTEAHWPVVEAIQGCVNDLCVWAMGIQYVESAVELLGGTLKGPPYDASYPQIDMIFFCHSDVLSEHLAQSCDVKQGVLPPQAALPEFSSHFGIPPEYRHSKPDLHGPPFGYPASSGSHHISAFHARPPPVPRLIPTQQEPYRPYNHRSHPILERPVTFQMKGFPELGVRVYDCDLQFLEGRKETPLSKLAYRSISMRLNWPGYESFMGRIRVCDPEPTPKDLLLEDLGRIIEKFFARATLMLGTRI
ncbi:hypothetical protein BDP27DRAFT_1426955 [Rhodocollybia butyracea]|uniref:Uncharacterized protein n=1 Tax=Rhodocollybia butyracea TaxID=206335 RepID=A0A9P5U2B3_9AGAR|nr:hypothetical protein BDP27DRAFT_1426955 [Rhodocollybia butyracea]